MRLEDTCIKEGRMVKSRDKENNKYLYACVRNIYCQWKRPEKVKVRYYNSGTKYTEELHHKCEYHSLMRNLQ